MYIYMEFELESLYNYRTILLVVEIRSRRCTNLNCGEWAMQYSECYIIL